MFCSVIIRATNAGGCWSRKGPKSDTVSGLSDDGRSARQRTLFGSCSRTICPGVPFE
jgi:hypothetical protein